MNRRQRRWQLKAAGMLRVKNMYGPFTEIGQLWYNKTREEGNKLEAQMAQRMEKNRDEFFASKDASMRENLKEFGYSNEQIELMQEAWAITVIKDKETYRADRKRAQELLRQARALTK